MTFTFSIRTGLRQSWQLFAKHPLFFSSMAFVMIIFNLFARNNNHHPLLIALVSIATILWTYVWISVALAAVDGKEDTLTFNMLSFHMPSVREFFMLLAVGIVTGLIVLGGFIIPILLGVFLVSLISFSYIAVSLKILIVLGFILLLVPGVYLATRLVFATTAYVDRQGSVSKSLNYSWYLVKGKIFWTVFLTIIVELALICIGSLLFFIGLLIAYPLAILLMVHLYRYLTIQHRHRTHPATTAEAVKEA